MKKNEFALFSKLLVLMLAVTIFSCIPEDFSDQDVESSEILAARNNEADQNQLLASIKQSTAKFQRVEEAVAAGYMPASPCVFVPGLGAMGIHYVKFMLVDEIVDPTQPEALLYEPMKNGRLNLVGVEYIVNATDFEDGHDVPMLGNKEMDNHLHGAPLGFPHYQLHVWVWKNNPNGMYTPFNPKVSCEYYEGDIAH